MLRFSKRYMSSDLEVGPDIWLNISVYRDQVNWSHNISRPKPKEGPVALLDKYRGVLYNLRMWNHEVGHHSLKYNTREDLKLFAIRIKPRFRYFREWKDFWDQLKRAYVQTQTKDWQEVLPDKVAIWASQRLQYIAREYSCNDNYRVARVGNTPQERRYRRLRKQGCCGFFDCIEVCPHDGLPYRLGFNYGH